MTARRPIDVSALPTYAFGHRSTIWWGVLGAEAIEGTMLALLLASWFYVRGNFQAWPPVEPGARVLHLAAAEVLLLAASAVPTHLANVAALAGNLRALRRWLVALVVVALAFLAVRAELFRALPFHWDRDAYASVLWGFLVMNTIHAASGVVETAVLVAVALVGPFEKEHLVDAHAGGFLWYFVVFTWIPLWFLLFAAPGLLRR